METALECNPIRVFWAPGCSSCQRTKEFLTRHKIPFESVNVAANPEALQELAAVGAQSIPIVMQGSRFVYAQSLADLAKFLGIKRLKEQRLDPQALIDKANIVLPAAARYVRQLPTSIINIKVHDFRPPCQIGYHVFRVSESFLDAIRTPQELSFELTMQGTDDVKPSDDVAAYGERVLREFNTWWDSYPDKLCRSQMPTYWGTQSVHEVLERTVWHSAHHTRQLISVLEDTQLQPDRPLTSEDLEGLPMPEKTWGE